MLKLFLSPHNDDESLFGAYTLMREKPLVVVVFGTASYMGNEYDGGKSEEIARSKGATILHVDSHDQVVMRNAAIDYLRTKGIKWALIVDADEWWEHKSLEGAMQFIQETVESGAQCEAFTKEFINLFRQPTWATNKLYGTRQDGLVAIRTDRVTERRRETSGFKVLIPEDVGGIYHFSYAKDPAFIKRKLGNFSHASEVIEGWYENTFLPCRLESTNVHPTVPTVWPTLREITLPKEIKERFVPYD